MKLPSKKEIASEFEDGRRTFKDVIRKSDGTSVIETEMHGMGWRINVVLQGGTERGSIPVLVDLDRDEVKVMGKLHAVAVDLARQGKTVDEIRSAIGNLERAFGWHAESMEPIRVLTS